MDILKGRDMSIQDEALVVVSTVGRVRVIEINRPDVRNCVNRPTAELLFAAFDAFDKDDQVFVAVLCGRNGFFCAGADLSAVSSKDKSLTNKISNDPSHAGPMGPSRMQLSKPVIAAIDGYAVAGGLELALWCDLRVVEEDAIMGVFCRRWGVPLIDGGTVRLPRLIGLSNAMDLILTGRAVGSAEAKQMGLANRVVKKGQSRAAAIQLAESLCMFPQTCMRSDRQSAYECHGVKEIDALIMELQFNAQALLESADGAKRFTDEKIGRGGSFTSFGAKI
jgi:enoyl-CoA hydratase